ncbi:hypothetical protein GCM10020256_53880 [Streptomyces thermocoprophilus]
MAHAHVDLTAGTPVQVSLRHAVDPVPARPIRSVLFALAHQEPQRDPDELIAEAVEAARAADTAVVVVATTERVESEGFDREDLRLPGHQDALVEAVAAVNPDTVVVVNAGSPVELPWRERVAAILLTWFPGQEGGAALADVLTGTHEPGGRLPTTWGSLADAPVTQVVPTDGRLTYSEGVFIGYRAWERAGRTPAYPFGHGLGYTDWAYESVETDGTTVKVRVRNTGPPPRPRDRPGVPGPPPPPTPAHRNAPPAGWPASQASTPPPAKRPTPSSNCPGAPSRYGTSHAERGVFVKGSYEIQVGRSLTDRALTAAVNV